VSTAEFSADAQLGKADSLFKARQYSEAEAAYQAALDTAAEEFNFSIEAEALSQLARCCLTTGRKTEGRTYLEKAGQKANISDPMGWSRYLSVKGRYQWKDDSLEAARETFIDMFNFCRENGLWGRMIDASNMMVIVSDKLEDQVAWSEKGIEAAEAGGEEQWLGPLWNNLAGSYFDAKRYDSALECYLKARDYHWRFSDESSKLFADYHIGMSYRFLGQFDEAKKWLRPVLAWAERMEHHSAAGQASQDMGEIDIAEGKTESGVEMLKRARREYEAAGYSVSMPDILESLTARIAQLGG
jgi:tetratricopeptide (TPR) repeat protein